MDICLKQLRVTAEAILPILLPLGMLTWENAEHDLALETG